jgi:uncharacterized protein
MTSAFTLSPSEAVAPVSAQERIESMDVLRGAAVLGILLMNILSFGLALGGGWNPQETTLNGGNTRANLAYWFTSQIFFEGKMRCLFSLLFGAGTLLFIRRGTERGGGLRVADIYYRRTLWLLLFGVIHAYCIWVGDILYAYAIFGLMLFPFRQAKPKWLILAAVILFLLGTARGMWNVSDDYQLRARGRAAAQLAAEGKPLTEEQKADQKKWEEREKRSKAPDPERVKKEVEGYRGSYAKVFMHRIPTATNYESIWLYRSGLNDIAAVMLIGMALLMTGVLTGERSKRFYLILMLCGYGIGGTINALTGWYLLKVNFNPIEGYAAVVATYDIERVLVALGHIGLLISLLKRGWLRAATSRLRACGQMALSCYLTTSLVCSTLFYGYGFGLFAKLQRYQLLYVVFAVWALLLIVSPIWLRHFRYGPMEWVWRSLTYWRKQPMRLREPVRAPQLEPSTVA